MAWPKMTSEKRLMLDNRARYRAYRDPNPAHKPHQGAREIARRKRQIEADKLRVA